MAAPSSTTAIPAATAKSVPSSSSTEPSPAAPAKSELTSLAKVIIIIAIPTILGIVASACVMVIPVAYQTLGLTGVVLTGLTVMSLSLGVIELIFQIKEAQKNHWLNKNFRDHLIFLFKKKSQKEQRDEVLASLLPIRKKLPDYRKHSPQFNKILDIIDTVLLILKEDRAISKQEKEDLDKQIEMLKDIPSNTFSEAVVWDLLEVLYAFAKIACIGEIPIDFKFHHELPETSLAKEEEIARWKEQGEKSRDLLRKLLAHPCINHHISQTKLFKHEMPFLRRLLEKKEEKEVKEELDILNLRYKKVPNNTITQELWNCYKDKQDKVYCNIGLIISALYYDNIDVFDEWLWLTINPKTAPVWSKRIHYLLNKGHVACEMVQLFAKKCWDLRTTPHYEFACDLFQIMINNPSLKQGERDTLLKEDIIQSVLAKKKN